MSRHCADCGADISRRCTTARYCFACTYTRSGRGGAAQAWSAVNRAVARGELRPAREFNCTRCGQRPALDYEHRDYSAPMDVKPVCRSCNRLLGAGRRTTEDTQHAA